MNKFELSQFLTNLANYYERKTPSAGTTELWFSKVQQIPGESLKWIEDQIESSNEIFPKNMPGVMWMGYRNWMESNPDKVTKRYEMICVDGCDDGLLFASKQKGEGESPVRYSYVFACDKCGKGPLGYPRGRMSKLLMDGYEDESIRRPHGTAHYKKVQEAKKTGIRGLVAGLVEKFTNPGPEILPNSADGSRYGVAMQPEGVEACHGPSDEELNNVGQI